MRSVRILHLKTRWPRWSRAAWLLVVGSMLALPGCSRPSSPSGVGGDLQLPSFTAGGPVHGGAAIVELEVAADGGIRIAGRETRHGLGGVRAFLRELPETPTQAVLRLDRRIPWSVVSWLMVLLTEPEIDIHRLQFVGRLGESDDEVAITYALPRGTRGPNPIPDELPDLSVVRLRVEPRAQATSPGTLYGALQRIARETRATCHVGLRVPAASAASTGYVLALLDVILRSDVASAAFDGALPPPPAGGLDAMLAAVGELREGPVPHGVSWWDHPLDGRPSGDSALPRPRQTEGEYGCTDPNASRPAGWWRVHNATPPRLLWDGRVVE